MIVFFLFFFFNSLHSSSLVHSNLLTVILPRSIPFETSAVAWPTFELTIFRPPFNYFVRLYRHGSSLPFDFYPATVPIRSLVRTHFFVFFSRRILVFPVFPFLSIVSYRRWKSGRLLFWLVDGAGFFFFFILFFFIIRFQFCGLDLASSDCLFEPFFIYYFFMIFSGENTGLETDAMKARRGIFMLPARLGLLS